MMLGLIYFFAFILIWFITELTVFGIEGKTDFSYSYILDPTSYLSSLSDITDYVVGLTQLIIHIQHQRKERFCQSGACHSCTDACALFEDFSILGSS